MRQEEERGGFDWEVLKPKTLKKVRKPVKLTCWFGDEDSSGSSSADEVGEEAWKEVDTKKKREEEKAGGEEKKKEKINS